jgi:hypothetical protein
MTLSSWAIVVCLAGVGYWGMSFAISEFRDMRRSRRSDAQPDAAVVSPTEDEPEDRSG